MDTMQNEPRTAKATQAARLAAQRKRARYLEDRGWICVEPDTDLHHEVGQMRAHGIFSEEA